MSASLDTYIPKYDKFILTGDFNAEDSEPELRDFLDIYDAENLQKEKTCFKNLDNPSCIDLIITNNPMSFLTTTTVTNGLSDFHKLSLTVFKSYLVKRKPKVVTYRDYKGFTEDVFKKDLKSALTGRSTTYKEFENSFLSVLEIHAPLRKKVIRANHAPYMTKCLRKAIMRRSQLQTKYYNTKDVNDYDIFKKQRNFVSKLYKKEKRKFYKNLDINDLLDNKTFWKYMKPLFSEKYECKPEITLVDGDNIITEDQDLAETFSIFFKKAVSNLEIKENHDILDFVDPSEFEDPVDLIIAKYKNHPSILKIKKMVPAIPKFNFSEVLLEDIEDQLRKLNIKKATTFKNIPTKLLKENVDVCGPVLLKLINNALSNNEFPDELKLADVTPIFKNGDSTNVKNYRPISILPTTSKIFERIIQTQVSNFMHNHLSPILCGYRKGFSSQHALISLLEKWRMILDKKGYAGAILMDLSKAFDCINHDLMIAKLIAYGFSKEAVTLIRSYLKDRWQHTKINTSFSSWYELIMGVPQGTF